MTTLFDQIRYELHDNNDYNTVNLKEFIQRSHTNQGLSDIIKETSAIEILKQFSCYGIDVNKIMSNETTDTCIIDNLECQDFNNQDYNQLIIDIHNKKGIDKKLKDKYKTAINEDYLTVKQTNQSKMHIILSQFQELLDEVISTTDSALQLRLFGWSNQEKHYSQDLQFGNYPCGSKEINTLIHQSQSNKNNIKESFTKSVEKIQTHNRGNQCLNQETVSSGYIKGFGEIRDFYPMLRSYYFDKQTYTHGNNSLYIDYLNMAQETKFNTAFDSIHVKNILNQAVNNFFKS